MSQVTKILEAIERGDPAATEELLPVVYDEMRSIAAAMMSREKRGQTLQATALVHEAYLRLVGDPEQRWQSRGHFFGAAAEAMRRILVDKARHKKRLKRGGDYDRVELDPSALSVEDPSVDILALDECLEELAQQDPEKAQVVKLRFFAGLTNAQTAAALGLSLATVKRYWVYAKTWLRLHMDSPG